MDNDLLKDMRVSFWCILSYSAGVGRTGTLVALDSLVMELDEEGHASIFNLICDLRHQRNFLVQSLVSLGVCSFLRKPIFLDRNWLVFNVKKPCGVDTTPLHYPWLSFQDCSPQHLIFGDGEGEISVFLALEWKMTLRVALGIFASF